MKNITTFTRLVLIIFLLTPVSVFGQNDWFIPNHPYTFRSLNGNDTTKAVTITVIYDQNSNADVWVSSSSTLSSDKETFVSFVPPSDWIQTEDTLFYENKSNNGSYYIFPFDGTTNYSMLGGNCLMIICNCRIGNPDADCAVSYLLNNGVLTATCIPDPGCFKCKMSKKDCTGNLMNGPGLVLKAASITTH